MEQMKTLTIGGKTYEVTDGAAVKKVNGISPDAEGNLTISTGSTVEVDATLTQEGKAADAKAVGDALKGSAVVFTVDAEGNAIIK